MSCRQNNINRTVGSSTSWVAHNSMELIYKECNHCILESVVNYTFSEQFVEKISSWTVRIDVAYYKMYSCYWPTGHVAETSCISLCSFLTLFWISAGFSTCIDAVSWVGDRKVFFRNKLKRQELIRRWHSERELFYDHIIEYLKI